MTAPARIKQDEYDRALKALKRAGYERARIRIDLANQVIDIMIDGTGDSSPPPAEPPANPLDRLLPHGP